MVNSSKYQSWMEISVEEVVEQTSSVDKVTVKKMPGADDKSPRS